MSELEIILTRAQAREADRIAIEEYGIPGVVLMENAGRTAAEIIVRNFEESKSRKVKTGPAVQIFCGPGNNGGDGYVIARHLANTGFNVCVILACERARVGGDAAVNLRIIEKMGIAIFENDRLEGSAPILVDALLGTGSVGDPRGVIADAINFINNSKRAVISSIVFAIDIPSGLDADGGMPGKPTVKADHTITFMGAKVGFSATAAGEYLGRVHLVDIGVPHAIFRRLTAHGAGT